MPRSSTAARWALGAVGVLLVAALARWSFAIDYFNPSDQPVGYMGQPELTGYNLRTGNEVMFRGEYEREFWSGTVFAYQVDSAARLKGGSSWWNSDAGDLMDQQFADGRHNTVRRIGTMRDGDGNRIPFRMDSLSANQKALLGSEDVLNFLRGDRSKERPPVEAAFRQRISILGDILHSRPYYVADTTNPTLFVGANDGMLHALNAGNKEVGGGQERWAYVPSMLMPKLKSLSDPAYKHDYFVDGQINVSEILAGSKRILVSGLGGGGRGLFALDITGSAGLVAATEQAAADKALWEISPTKINYANPTTDNAYVNLGFIYGTPLITRVKVGGETKYAVIVGNGFNDGRGSYADCKHASAPSYANCGGNYAAYLYVINAENGQLLMPPIKAGSNGTSATPNGLSTPVGVDRNGDGHVDTVFAGDLNGTMWKFDLQPASGAATATALVSTTTVGAQTAQAITSTPGVAAHPNGGYMVTFGTGKMLTPNDAKDTASYYLYGVWDQAPAANTKWVEQTMTERTYTGSESPLEVRRVTSNKPNWSSGNHRGWFMKLPTSGERVVGDGSYIESGRFYVTASNPTISRDIPNTVSKIYGRAWLLEVDYLSGGVDNNPYLDLNGDSVIDDKDRITYVASDEIPEGKVAGDPILTTDGVPVGKFIAEGVVSQPILVQLVTLNNTLFNTNPDTDVAFTYPVADPGVEGGHFDVEIYYGPRKNATRAKATITVGTNGQTAGYPATLGNITVNGVIAFKSMSTSDLKNGTDSITNANVLRGKASNGFSATVSGNVVTIQAPAGASYNGMSLDIAAGTSKTLVPGVVKDPAQAPTDGQLRITAVNRFATDVSIKCGSAYVTTGDLSGFDLRDDGQRLVSLRTAIHGKTSNDGYKTSCSAIADGAMNCSVAAPAGPSACAAGFTLQSLTATSNTGPQGGTAATYSSKPSGWTNFKPALTTTNFSGGTDATVDGNLCGSNGEVCTFREHEHEYDDMFDRTGVDFLNASNANFNLERMLPSMDTQFKVLVQNQYLSPAVKLHIGNPGYVFNVDAGYVWIKEFQTGKTLSLSTVPTYTRATIGSLALNLPSDAFGNKDWWGGLNGLKPDVRDGLHPTEYGCVVESANAVYDGNMYRPVVPPAEVTSSGNGTRGWSSSTDQTTAQGVRHNGALTVQIIKANTPQSAIEMSIPDRSEYGWRVKAAHFAEYVIGEYSIFHHTKHLGLCYGDVDRTFTLYGTKYTKVSWTKTPAVDTRACGDKDSSTVKVCATATRPAVGSTDPVVGKFGREGTIATTTVTVEGNVTTITVTYADGGSIKTVRTRRADGGYDQVTTFTDVKDPSKNRTESTSTAGSAGDGGTGGDEKVRRAHTGRISWHELQGQ